MLSKSCMHEEILGFNSQGVLKKLACLSTQEKKRGIIVPG